MYQHSDIFDGGCTKKQYYAQWDTVSPKVGDTYVTHPNTWQENTVEILYVDDVVALGVVTKGLSKGERTMYHAKGDNAGWKYQDSRVAYRLQNIGSK